MATVELNRSRASLMCELRSLDEESVLGCLVAGGSSQREHSVRSGCVIHEERGLRADVVRFALVKRVGRPGTFCPVLIRFEPREPPLQFGIFGRNPGPLKNKGDQPRSVSVTHRFLRRSIRALPVARQRRQAPATVSLLLFQKLANQDLLPIVWEQSR